MIDLEIPQDAKDVRARVARFIDDVVLPAEKEVGKRPYYDIVAELQGKARAEGLWCPFIPVEWGGMGLGHLANALVQLEVGRSTTYLGAWALNCMGPQDATMLTLLQFGTEQQKEKYLRPLIDGQLRICFSMTERAAGADATGMQTFAVKDGDNWVLNGEKWFSSNASDSNLALVMAKTDPDAPRHQQFSTFIVELPNPGYKIERDIETLDGLFKGKFEGEHWGAHPQVTIADLVVPEENLLGGRGKGFEMGQYRLGYGRARHCMWNIAKAQMALDLAAKRATERVTFGKRLADRQGIQWMLADAATELYIARLMMLHLAYKMEKGENLRHENSIAKTFSAHMVHKVVDTALQIHGSLGYTLDTPLAAWYGQVRGQRIIDGPDEVHRWIVGKNVIKAYEENGTTASAAGGDLF
jgi:acyl-CoA dehydrogenase